MNKSHHWPKRVFILCGLLTAMAALIGIGFTAVSPTHAAVTLISGTVTDPTGSSPPASTLVHLVTPGGDAYGTAQVDDLSGAFSLGPVPNGNYTLVATVPGDSPYTPSLPVSINVTGTPVDAGTLALTYPSITGSVFAPDGETPVTALVTVHRAGFLVQSDLAISGTLQLGGLLSGTYRLEAHPATDDPYWRSAPQPLTVTTGVSQTVNLTLRPANVAGIITDPNGVPVPGATVHVLGQNLHQYRRDDASGSGYFAIGDLPPDTYTLVVEPPYYADGLMASRIITFTVPPDFTDLGQIALRSAPKVVEGVVETNTGLPIENARVIANRLDHPGHQEALTNSNGRYLLRLSGGLWGLTVEPTEAANPAHWVYPDPPLLVHFDDDLRPEFKNVSFTALTADATVSGLVAMPGGGTPPFTVTVALRTNEGIGRATLVDSNNGSFALQVPHGSYILHVQPHDPGYFGPLPQPVYVPANGALDVGTLTLVARDATISGMVQNELGDGVEGVRVVAWNRGHQGAQTRTNPDGSYVLAVSAGDWQVKPHVPAEMPYVYQGTAVSLTLTSQQHITAVNFALTPANNQVVGQLVDENGRAVSATGWATASDTAWPGERRAHRRRQFHPLPARRRLPGQRAPGRGQPLDSRRGAARFRQRRRSGQPDPARAPQKCAHRGRAVGPPLRDCAQRRQWLRAGQQPRGQRRQRH